MFVIRAEQMRVLVAEMRKQFVDRLEPLYASQWPKQTGELGPRYRAFLDSAVDRAISHGINAESDIARFINLCFVWGAEFERSPEHGWAMRILRNPAFDGTRKVRELASRTSNKLLVLQLNKGPSDV